MNCRESASLLHVPSVDSEQLPTPAAQAIPPRFLELILGQLRQGGFIVTTRTKPPNSGSYLDENTLRRLSVGTRLIFEETRHRARTRGILSPGVVQLSLCPVLCRLKEIRSNAMHA